jgi:transposase
MSSIAYVGLDVHKDKIAVALFVGNERNPTVEDDFDNTLVEVKKRFRRWSNRYDDLRCCYEASSCGYVLQRWLTDMGIHCEIASPSLIPTLPGDKRKTDRRDAKKLGRLYRAGELSFVHIPTEKEESVRSLVRCRETIRYDLLRSRHYVLKFLQLRGLSWHGGRNWTTAHMRYLKSLKFEGPNQIAWCEYMCLMEYKLSRLEELDRQIEELAFSDAYAQMVGSLRCFKGVDTHTAMVLVSEIGDISRFANAEQFMSYLGLAPGSYQSGNVSRDCPITKAGNSHCRHVLVEAAWHYRHCPYVSRELKARQAGQDVRVVAISWKAQHRLHKKFTRLCARTHRNKAAVAVARELAGFIWAVGTLVFNVGLSKAA